MNKRFLVLVALLGVLPAFVRAADPQPNYDGRYELAGHSSQRVFKLSLSQKGSRVHAVFFASDSAAPDAQPTAVGDGRVNGDGVLELKFKDNLANRGIATFEHSGQLYRFDIRVTDIVDMAPLHFYGVIAMKKIGDPSPSAKPPAI